jgi:hypothetical protein
MDITTLLIFGGLALAIIAAALFALNRSWGDFPGRAGTLPPPGAAAPGFSNRPALSPLDRAPGPGAPPDPAAASGLVLIQQPLVRRAAEQALRRGGPMTKYIVQQGDQIYFSFDRIDDPAQRQEAYELMRSFQAGENVDLRAIMRLINQISKG